MTGASTYLGDGVEATCDGFHLVLTADQTKTIYLDPGVLAAAIRYALASGLISPERLRELVAEVESG